MKKVLEVELTLYPITILGLLIIIGLYLRYPVLFFRHPNQLYFYSLIFQLLFQSLCTLSDIIILQYHLYRDISNGQVVNCIGYSAMFAFFLFYHYIVVLNFEIVIKIARLVSQKYKKRVLIYHVISIVMSVVMIYLVIDSTNYQLEYTEDSNSKLAFKSAIWYVYAMFFSSFFCIGVYIKHIIAQKSTSLLNMLILTIAINICVFIGIILPQTSYNFNFSYEIHDILFWVEIAFGCSSGIIQCFIVIFNKKCIGLIKAANQKRIIEKNKQIQRKCSKELRMNSLLMGLDEVIQNPSDGGLLGNFFERITKDVIKN